MPFNEIRRNGTAEAYADDASFDFGGGADGYINIDGEIGTGITYNEPHMLHAIENTTATYTNLFLGWNVVYGRPWKPAQRDHHLPVEQIRGHPGCSIHRNSRKYQRFSRGLRG